MPYIASMGIYVVSKDVMLDLLRDKFPGSNDFGSEVIPGATSIGMRVRCKTILFSFLKLSLTVHLNNRMLACFSLYLTAIRFRTRPYAVSQHYKVFFCTSF